MKRIATIKTKLNFVFGFCFIFGFVFYSNAAPISTTTPSADLAFAQNFLANYGYYSTESQYKSPNKNLNLKTAIEEMQKYAGLKITGVLDKATLKQMAIPRCQVPDVRNTSSSRYAALTKWRKNTLTYKIENGPTKIYNLAVNNVPAILAKSFKDWTDASNLIIKPTSGPADIQIGFFTGDHGDSYPFDRNGGVLAHAFFPSVGQLHFDNSETWSDLTSSGINMRQVATHEMGHVLGLSHSPVKSAVMFPYYSSYNPKFSLQLDDFLGIQSLYGAPIIGSGNPSQTASTSRPVTTTKRPWYWWLLGK